MIACYRTEDGHLKETETPEKGGWINMVAPSEGDLLDVVRKCGVDMDMLRASLDPEESARIDSENGSFLILVDLPTIESDGKESIYSTIPLGLIRTADGLITVCLRDSHILRDFSQGRIRDLDTNDSPRFILQILYRISTRYLQYLRQIDRKTNTVEAQLQKNMRNKDLMQLTRLEKSLVFFATSLKSNEIVLERLMRSDLIHRDPEDEDTLEDVIVENKQAIEMCAIQRDILGSTMNAFSSVISNNLNDSMKILTSLTLVLSIPTLIASIWGMNVAVPFASAPWGFWALLGLSALLSTVSIIILSRHKML